MWRPKYPYRHEEHEMNALPDYDELPVKPGKPPHSAWGLWGDDDQIGAINLLTLDRVIEGARQNG